MDKEAISPSALWHELERIVFATEERLACLNLTVDIFVKTPIRREYSERVRRVHELPEGVRGNNTWLCCVVSSDTDDGKPWIGSASLEDGEAPDLNDEGQEWIGAHHDNLPGLAEIVPHLSLLIEEVDAHVAERDGICDELLSEAAEALKTGRQWLRETFGDSPHNLPLE